MPVHGLCGQVSSETLVLVTPVPATDTTSAPAGLTRCGTAHAVVVGARPQGMVYHPDKTTVTKGAIYCIVACAAALSFGVQRSAASRFWTAFALMVSTACCATMALARFAPMAVVCTCIRAALSTMPPHFSRRKGMDGASSTEQVVDASSSVSRDGEREVPHSLSIHA